jgi:retron-type reverse transcriptase
MKLSEGIDKESLYDFRLNEQQNLRHLLEQLKSGNYKFSALKVLPKLKSNKKNYRGLSIPIVKDRIIQKAMLKILTPLSSL